MRFYDKELKIIPIKQEIQKVNFSHLLKLEAHFLNIVTDTVAHIGISDTFWYRSASKVCGNLNQVLYQVFRNIQLKG